MKRRVTVPPIVKMLNICEIFKSIQGESTRSGMPCTFVRLSGCNLSCCYCDTPYAQEAGTDMTIDEILKKAEDFGCFLVTITGGEPLLQQETPQLCRNMLDHGYTVLVETNGSLDISRLPEGCIRIMDIKCPGSGCEESFLPENLASLTDRDECKMVISTRDDFGWACDFVANYSLHEKCTVLFSPNMDMLAPQKLAEWILEADVPVRLGLQIHKFIWDKDKRRV